MHGNLRASHRWHQCQRAEPGQDGLLRYAGRLVKRYGRQPEAVQEESESESSEDDSASG